MKQQISLDEADKIQAEQKALAEAEFNRLVLENGIGKPWHNAMQWHSTWLVFWQGWWVGFLKNKEVKIETAVVIPMF